MNRKPLTKNKEHLKATEIEFRKNKPRQWEQKKPADPILISDDEDDEPVIILEDPDTAKIIQLEELRRDDNTKRNIVFQFLLVAVLLLFVYLYGTYLANKR